MAHRVLHPQRDEQFFPERAFIGAGQLRHGQQNGACAVRTGKSAHGGLHHGLSAGGVKIDHIHSQPGKHAHGALHGVGNVMQFEIEKNPMPFFFQHTQKIGSSGIEKLHADL